MEKHCCAAEWGWGVGWGVPWGCSAGGRAGFSQGSLRVTGDVRLAWVLEVSGSRPGPSSLGESPFWAHCPEVEEASWI